MRPSDSNSKTRRSQRRVRTPRGANPFAISNREIMADLMYGRGDEPARRSGR